MKNRKMVSFLISLFSPVLPIAAILVIDRIEQAAALLIASAVILALVVCSVVMLLKTKEKSPGMKIVGTIFGVLGIVITVIVGLIAGWTLTKI
jgi:heme/copper-type cytochrome/quinol oxidase subunit 4